MKKKEKSLLATFLVLFISCIALPTKAQIPFTYYEPVQPQTNSTYREPNITFRQETQIPFTYYKPAHPVTSRNLEEIIIKDGLYEMNVNCRSSTGLDKNYILDVKITNDYVTYIYFGNGGSVHSGRNNSGYTWRGGGIRWTIEDGEITGGTAIMEVDYGEGQWQLFTIRF